MIQIDLYPHTATVTGVNFGSQLERAIKAVTFYMAPGYERDPLYQYGRWDGKVHLFEGLADAPRQGRHTIPPGLVPRVIEVLERDGHGYNLTNHVPPWKQDPNLAYLRKNVISVRPYQATGAMALLKGLPGFRRGGVEQAATGAGKTRVAAKLIQVAQVKTVFMVNQKDLMAQTIREFEAMLGCKVGQVGGGKCDIQDVTVCTVQTIALCAGFNEGIREKAPDVEKVAAIRKMMREAQLIIVDECHGVPARTSQAAVRLAENASIITGLSASPWRDDGMDILIEATCGPVVHQVTASFLINEGWLVPPTITSHTMPAPLSGKDLYASDFDKLYKAWVVNNLDRNRYIADLAQTHMLDGEVVLILVKQIEHGKLLNELIPYSEFMEGKLSLKKRKDIVAEAKRGNIRCLIATSLADQGLDIPILDVIILAGGGKSSTKALQRIGRVLRTTEGKNWKSPDYKGKLKATVHDIVDQHPTFKGHYNKRLKIYRTEPAFEVVVKNVEFASV